MNGREAMARRYCIMRGEDPDAIFNDKPVWHDALTDIDCVLLMLDSFGVQNPLNGLFIEPVDGDQMTMDFDLNDQKIIKFGRQS